MRIKVLQPLRRGQGRRRQRDHKHGSLLATMPQPGPVAEELGCCVM
jgi:hypothetical protein